jgi:molybdate-binding protein
MKTMNTINQLGQLKSLGDKQRLAILRYLMAKPASLSQLGDHFGESPAHIRHHLKVLEAAGLVELISTRPVRGFIEKYYRATHQAYLVQMSILPESTGNRPIPILGSNDPALQQVFEKISPSPEDPACFLINLDSLEGLVRLREGICEMATVHLLAAEEHEYNRPYVRHMFPGEAMVLIRLYQREQGLLVQAGNPLNISSVSDLSRPGIRLINRERGAGTRVWLDDALERQGIARDQINGYANDVRSHIEVARMIAQGNADVGIGLPSSARHFGLDFIPLFEEPYELVLTQKVYTDPRFSRFFDMIASKQFQEEIQAQAGYHGLQNRGQARLIS